MLHLLSSLAGGEARQPARPDVGLAGKPGGESGSRIRHPRTEPVVQVSVRAAVSREGLLLAAMDVSHAGFIRPVKKRPSKSVTAAPVRVNAKFFLFPLSKNIVVRRVLA